MINLLKFLAVIFLIIFSPSIFFAQTLNMDWGEVFSVSGSKPGIDKVIEDDENYYLIAGHHKKKILKYNWEKELLDVQEIKFRDGDRKLNFNGHLETKSGNYAVFYKLQKEFNQEDQYQLFVSKIENGEIPEPKKILQHRFKQTNKRFFEITLSTLDMFEEFSISQNKSSIVYASKFKRLGKKNDKQELVFAVFDDSFNLKWETTQRLPYLDRNFAIQKVIVDDEGANIFLLGYLDPEKDRPDPEYKIFHITPNGMEEYAVALKANLYATSVVGYYKKAKNGLLLTGLYKSSKSRRDHRSLKGIFSQELGLKNGANSNTTYFKFSEKEREDLLGSFHIPEFRLLPNGNFQFIANCQKNDIRESEVQPFSGAPKVYGPRSCTTSDFIFCTINQEGKIKRKTIKRKNNYDYYGKRYTWVKNGNQSYFIFDTKNSDRDKKKFKLKFSKIHMLTKLIHFDGEGELAAEELLFHTKTKKTRFIFNSITAFVRQEKLFIGGKIEKMSQGPMAIHGKGKYAFGTINLEELQ